MSLSCSSATDTDAAANGATPRAVTARRIAFGFATVGSWVALLALFATALAPAGFDLVDLALLTVFALYLPWPLLGFWNAAIGFAIMRFARDPLALTCPPAGLVREDDAIHSRVAIALCIRNEDAARVFRNAGHILDDLARTPWAGHFSLHILSDTDQPDIAHAEETATRLLREHAASAVAIHYRRRENNAGFKAGNIREFCEHGSGDAELMLVLDADSLMSAERILRMVRIMQASPRLGILQSLTVGLPSSSPLARLFQFGMRLGMRSYTMGSAWWHADCGPYWGHNALIRIEPFLRHCHLPRVPGPPPLGGDILSHDQVEAVLMRRAGYEVRVLPEEGGSFEENPPNLVEHMRRDTRWCLGNMQYFRLLDLPGLRPASRFQLVLALLMFLASPAFLALWSLLLVQALRHEDEIWLAPGAALSLLVLAFILMFAPKIASAMDVMTRRSEAARFGGRRAFLGGLLAETLFSLLITPISALSHTMTIAALTVGRGAGWGAQARDAHGVSFREACSRFWPHTLVGAAAACGLIALTPMALLYAAPVYAGLLLAIPFAMMTGSPALGVFMKQRGWCAIPEEARPDDKAKRLAATPEIAAEAG